MQSYVFYVLTLRYKVGVAVRAHAGLCQPCSRPIVNIADIEGGRNGCLMSCTVSG